MNIKQIKLYLKEAKKSEYQELIDNNKLSLEDFNRHIFKKNKWKGPFKDSIFNDIVFRSIEQNINIDFNKLNQVYDLYKQKILEPINRDNANIEYTLNNVKYSINSLIDNNEINLNHIKEFLMQDEAEDPTENFLEKVLRDALKSSSSDLDVVYEDIDIVVFYPKTLIGSKAACRAYFKDGEYYVDELNRQIGPVIGPVKWCIAVDGDNRFNLYKNTLGMNLYISIKKNLDSSGKGRMCLGFKKDKEGNVTLETDTEYAASLTGDNYLATDERIDRIIGRSVYDKIVKDVEKSNRPISKPEKDYWEAYPEEGFVRELKRFKKKKDNPHIKQEFLAKLFKILYYTKKKNIRKSVLLSNDDDIYKAMLGNSYSSYAMSPAKLISEFNATSFLNFVSTPFGIKNYWPFNSLDFRYNSESFQSIWNGSRDDLIADLKLAIISYFKNAGNVNPSHIDLFIQKLERSGYLSELIDDEEVIEVIKRTLHEEWWDNLPNAKTILYGARSVNLDINNIKSYYHVKKHMDDYSNDEIIGFVKGAYERHFGDGNDLSTTDLLRSYLNILDTFKVEWLNKFDFINEDFAERYIDQAEKSFKKDYVQDLENEFRSNPSYEQDFTHNLIEELASLYNKKRDTVSYLRLAKLQKKMNKAFYRGERFFNNRVKNNLKKHKEEKGLSNYIKSYIQQYL